MGPQSGGDRWQLNHRKVSASPNYVSPEKELEQAQDDYCQRDIREEIELVDPAVQLDPSLPRGVRMAYEEILAIQLHHNHHMKLQRPARRKLHCLLLTQQARIMRQTAPL